MARRAEHAPDDHDRTQVGERSGHEVPTEYQDSTLAGQRPATDHRSHSSLSNCDLDRGSQSDRVPRARLGANVTGIPASCGQGRPATLRLCGRPRWCFGG
jgi:hypothetical protein